MEKLKKKLFIVGAYLVIATLLLIYVSYAAYRISFSGEINMPVAKKLAASINLDYNLTDVASYSNLVLDNLVPGEDAEYYANNPTATQSNLRTLMLTVSNRSLTGTTSNSTEYMDLDYSVEIEELGPVPLEIILVHGDPGEEERFTAFTGLATDSQPNYGRQTATFSNADGEEPLFTFGSDGIEYFKLYFGWNNSEDVIRHGGYSASLQKEVSVINIKLKMIGRPYQITDFTYIVTPSQVYKKTTVTPSNASTSVASPGNVVP